MMRSTLAMPTLVVLAAAALTACSNKQQAMPPVPPVAVDDTGQAGPHTMDMDVPTRPDSDDRDRERRMAEARNTMTATIYFEFDRSDLTAAARSALDAKLAIMTANPGMRIRIAGHTDERGSDEYNVALGQRRAAMAKRYLTDRGVAGDRVEMVSYGEERPATEGNRESAWSQNRRDEFEITAGAEIAVLP